MPKNTKTAVTVRVKAPNAKIVRIVGTGHVLKESVRLVRKEIEDFEPDVVAVELDENRAKNIGKKPRTAKTARKGGLAYTMLFLLQQRAGKTTGVKPGQEMMAAIQEARRFDLPVAFIDRDIRVTMRRAFGNLSWMDKLRLLKAFIFGLFETGSKEQINEVLSMKDELLKEFKKEFPSMYNAFLTERDAFMAQNIKKLPQKRVLAVVGAGHLKGIAKKLGAKPRTSRKPKPKKKRKLT